MVSVGGLHDFVSYTGFDVSVTWPSLGGSISQYVYIALTSTY